MRPKAAFSRRTAVVSCSSPKLQVRRWICWTKPPQPLRRGWSGKAKSWALGEGLRHMNQKLLGVAGIIVILAIAFLLSTNRKAIRPRVVGAAFLLQAGVAFLVLATPWGAVVLKS